MRQGKVALERATFETLYHSWPWGFSSLLIEKLKCREKDEKKEKGG